jgi:6-phosphogluconolactonase
MTPPELKVMVYDDSDRLAREVAASIVELAKEAVVEHGQCTLALSGGSTPRRVYEVLGKSGVVDDMPWEHTLLFWGDERVVKPDHPDSNYRMVYEALLKGGPVPLENIVPIQTTGLDPATCAERYERTLHQRIRRKSEGFPLFDLILLGIGNDGHTASLFPGTPAPLERTHAVTWCDPKQVNPAVVPAVPRVTLTVPVIWKASNVFVLAEGSAKKEVLAKVFAPGPIDTQPVARLVWRCTGQVRFFIDNAALPDNAKKA